MPAISFQREFLDALLRGDKQQTTRRQTDRIKVGDVCSIYVEQRSRITDKPERLLTADGVRMMTQKTAEGSYPYPREWCTNMYHAHFLGKFEITGVSDIHPCEMSYAALEIWARKDGFSGIADANEWFTERYGDDWWHQIWTVIRWDGWLERYFKSE